MKIDYSILSVNDNPLYSDFWDLNKRFWYEYIGIKPMLVYINKTKEAIEEDDDSLIFYIREVPNVDSGFQTQISRLYVTQFFPNDVLITSDIDMFPLSKTYFNNIVENIPNDKLAILSSDAYPSSAVRYPICYNVGKGNTFDNILDLELNFSIFCDKMLKYGWGWDTDEKYLGMKVNEKKDKCVFLNRGWENGIASKRLDRVVWGYNKNQDYIDCHSLRPYKQYKGEIDNLIKNYLK